MDKLELLKSISFGARVAEEEITELAKYFVNRPVEPDDQRRD
jgi:hypothetical protein